MDFGLSEEQRALRDLARRFAEAEIAPHAAEYDQSEEYPWPILEKGFEAGLMYANVPEALGGGGLSLLDECLVQEELAWGCIGISGAMTISNIPALGILMAGSEEQQRRMLGETIERRGVLAYALTEPGAGSDVRAIRTSARKIGNEYSVSGSKCFISSADAARAFLLFAVTDPGAGHRGITAFWVPSDRPGVRVGPAEKKMGQRAAHICSIYFDDVKVAASDVIGGEGSGFKLAMEVFNRSRPTISISGVGLARRAMEHAAAYANERSTMGKPIIEHQGVGFMLADMDIKIAAARHLTLEAAWRADRGLPNSIEAARAKCLAADACMEVTTDAVQIFGGYGYMQEYPVEKLMRDAKVVQIYEGTTQIQRVIIAKSMAKRAAAAPQPAAKPKAPASA